MDATRQLRSFARNTLPTAGLLLLLCGCPAADPLGFGRPVPVTLDGDWSLVNSDGTRTLACARFHANTLVAYHPACNPDFPAVVTASQPVVSKGRQVIIQWSVRDHLADANLRFDGIASDDHATIEGTLFVGFPDNTTELAVPARLVEN